MHTMEQILGTNNDDTKAKDHEKEKRRTIGAVLIHCMHLVE